MAETFGKTEKGGGESMGGFDYLDGCKFQSGSAGSLASISVYVKRESVDAKIKCAIYDSSYNLLSNGTTEEKNVITGQDGWMTFNFPSHPEVAALTDYWLLRWSENDILWYYDAGAFEQRLLKMLAYGDWPASFSGPLLQPWEFSIYATYEEAPPPKKRTLVQMCNI